MTRAKLSPLAAPQIRVETCQTLKQSVDFFTLDSLERIDPPGAARDIAFNLLEVTDLGFHDFLLIYFFAPIHPPAPSAPPCKKQLSINFSGLKLGRSFKRTISISAPLGMPRGEKHRMAAFHPQCFQCALMLPNPIIPILRLEVVATWERPGRSMLQMPGSAL